MADSTTSSLNLSTESNQVVAEDARKIQIANQATADDGNLTQIIFMDPKLYVAAAHGDIHVLERHDIRVQRTPKKNTVLHVAAQFGQADFVEKILKLPSLSSLLQHHNEKGDTPLHLAVREGHLTVVKNLIHAAKKLGEEDTERGAAADWKVMLRTTNNEQDTALHEAVRNHHPEVVKLLIQEDPDFTYGANTEGNTPLYIAAEWGFGDLVQMILDNCSSPAHSGFSGRTALHAAVILKDPAMTKKILEWKPALTKELDKNGWSPLHFAAYVGCHPTIVTQLLEKSDTYVVYLGVKNHGIGNRTALHIAASRGHVEIVKLMVSHFPDCCEKVDDEGNNVLHLIMPEKKIFLTSGLSNIPWLRVRGLTYEKNGKGKTPLHLFHNSIIPWEPLFKLTWDTLLGLRVRPSEFAISYRRKRSSRIVSMRPLGSLEIKEDSGTKKVNKYLKLRNNESHMIVAALIATVTFAAGFTLPGGYIQNESNNQGLAVLSLPTNGTNGKDQVMAFALRENFRIFVMADGIVMFAFYVRYCCAVSFFIA
ncbi:Protein accelerated cell death 6 [Vitis vinifera]|uniref:Protein accelerated cell death 6 n=1 Tax=Vitis vinifera TaxID=29760 RepID=A0A438GKZ9_VITVI|nr:Protein accelerated cell death 6 [Vitis vinifera]